MPFTLGSFDIRFWENVIWKKILMISPSPVPKLLLGGGNPAKYTTRSCRSRFETRLFAAVDANLIYAVEEGQPGNGRKNQICFCHGVGCIITMVVAA